MSVMPQLELVGLTVKPTERSRLKRRFGLFQRLPCRSGWNGPSATRSASIPWLRSGKPDRPRLQTEENSNRLRRISRRDRPSRSEVACENGAGIRSLRVADNQDRRHLPR
jgi:hypothetical protein